MITKLKEDYMVSGMLYKKVGNTNEIKMVYLDVNIEKMTIGYKNHHLELAYAKQFGFKQVFSYETIAPFDKFGIKQGFKITFSETYFDFYTSSGKEYDIWLKGLKDYFEKKLKREKQLAHEEMERKLKLGTDMKTHEQFDTKTEFNNWSFDSEGEENHKIQKHKGTKSVNVSFEEHEEIQKHTTTEIKEVKEVTNIKEIREIREYRKDFNANAVYQIDTFELKQYRDPTYKRLSISNPINIILEKKMKRPDLYRVNHPNKIFVSGHIKEYNICKENNIVILKKKSILQIENYNNSLFIKATPKKRSVQRNNFEILKLKPREYKIAEEIGFVIDRTEKIIKAQRDNRFQFIYKRFANLSKEIYGMNFTIKPTEKVITFARQELNINYFRKALITIFDKATAVEITPTPKLLNIQHQNQFSFSRKVQPLIKCYLEDYIIFPTKKNLEIINNSFSIVKRKFDLVKNHAEFLVLFPTKSLFELKRESFNFPKTNFISLVKNHTAEVNIANKDKAPFKVTSQLSYNYIKEKPFLYKFQAEVHHIKATPKVFKIIGESNIYYPKRVFTLLKDNTDIITLFNVPKLFKVIHQEQFEIAIDKMAKIIKVKEHSLLLLPTPKLISIGYPNHFEIMRKQPILLKDSTINHFEINKTKRVLQLAHCERKEYIIKRMFNLSTNNQNFGIFLHGRKKFHKIVLDKGHHYFIHGLIPHYPIVNETEFTIINFYYIKPHLEFDNDRSHIVNIISTHKKLKVKSIDSVENSIYYDNHYEDHNKKLYFDYNSNDMELDLINSKNSNIHNTMTVTNVTNISKSTNITKVTNIHNHNIIHNNHIAHYNQNHIEDDEEIIEKRSKNPLFGGVNFISQRFKFRNNLVNDSLLKDF